MQIVWDGEEHCACELMERLCATQSRISRDMQRLEQAGLVIDRRDAQWVRYRKNLDLCDEWAAIVEAVLNALPPQFPALKAARHEQACRFSGRHARPGPPRARHVVAGKREGPGNIAAANLGIVTPFCSCSAVSLFVGFVSAGVPLGVTFSFLIAAPMVNAVALGLLFALVGWQVALTYLAFGLGLAIVAGWVIGRLHLESWLEP